MVVIIFIILNNVGLTNISKNPTSFTIPHLVVALKLLPLRQSPQYGCVA